LVVEIADDAGHRLEPGLERGEAAVVTGDDLIVVVERLMALRRAGSTLPLACVPRHEAGTDRSRKRDVDPRRIQVLEVASQVSGTARRDTDASTT
jgi:hypothetical protein